MAGRKVVEYLKAGFSPFAKWFSGLDAFAAAKVTVALYRLEQGNLSNVKALEKGCRNIRYISARATGSISARKATNRSSCLEAGPKKPRERTYRSPTCSGRSISRLKQERNEVTPCLLRVNSGRPLWTVL